MLIKPNTDILFPTPSELPPILLPWLTYEKSLTERLQSIAGEARMDILQEEWVASNWWDKYVLGIDNEPAFHRDILMWVKQDPCWYARTIIPQSTYQANQTLFNRLKNESLGAIIFNHTEIKRTSMKHYSINAQGIEYHWLKPFLSLSADELWVRLSIFTIKEKHSFCLTELLLPALEERYSI